MKKLLYVFLVLCRLQGFSQDPYIDSLVAVSQALPEDTNKVKLLNEISWEYLYSGENNNIIRYAQEAKNLSQKLNYTRGLTEAYSLIGHGLYRLGRYPETIESYLSALKLAEKNGDKKAISNIYHNIGIVYDSQEKFEVALQYNLKSLSIRRELKDSNLIAKSYHNMALVYLNQKKPDLAIQNLNLTLNTAKKNGDSLIEASCYHNIAIAYSDKKMYEEALRYSMMALKIREKLKSKPGLLKSYVDISAAYHNLGIEKEAEEYGLKALNLGREMGQYGDIMPVSLTLSMIYTKQKQFEKALQYYKEYSDARDSLISEESTAKTLRSQMNYEFEKKEMETKAEHDKTQAVAEAVSKKQQIIIWTVCALFVLAVIISLLIFRQNKFRTEQRTMQLEQKLLRSQMNPHFIFNSLTAIESFIYRSEPREAGRYLSGFARLMRLILDNSREEFVTLETEIQTLEHYLKLQKLRFDDSFDYSINISDDIDVFGIQIPPMLAQPFIENAVEHGLKGIQKRGAIEIFFSLKNNDLVFEVRDNGVGFEKTVALKDANSGHKSLATTITSERLKNLNKKKKNIQVVMQDLKNAANDVTGAQVIFLIPFTRL